LGVVAHW